MRKKANKMVFFSTPRRENDNSEDEL